MKTNLKLLISTLILMTGLVISGCENEDVILIDDPTPATPQGILSVTGDGVVWIYFNGIYEKDVHHYVIYRSFEESTGYEKIGSLLAESNPNLDLIIYEYPDQNVSNGVTYWYAVTAVDHEGQESELSAESVFDTPRPEGQIDIYPTELSPDLAGFNLASGLRVSSLSPFADVWIDTDVVYSDVFYLNVGNINIDIQDLGFTSNFDDVSYSPIEGWSGLGFVEIIEGHTYVIWTAENNYAKMRALDVGPTGATVFQWAYQTDNGNPELAPALTDKPERFDGYLKDRPGSDGNINNSSR